MHLPWIYILLVVQIPQTTTWDVPKTLQIMGYFMDIYQAQLKPSTEASKPQGIRWPCRGQRGLRYLAFHDRAEVECWACLDEMYDFFCLDPIHLWSFMMFSACWWMISSIFFHFRQDFYFIFSFRFSDSEASWCLFGLKILKNPILSVCDEVGSFGSHNHESLEIVAYPQPQVAHPQRVHHKHRWPVDRPVDHPHGRHGHDEVPSEGHGSDASEEGICLGDHGPGWSLGPCCFAFFSFLQKKKPNKKLLKVCRGLWLDCWIVGTRFESFLEFEKLKDNHFFFEIACRNHLLAARFFLQTLVSPGNFGHLNLSDPFDVKRRGSTYMTELRAGITTFLAMAYILPVNSGMLSLVIPGKREELVCATALAAFCGCWLMGILSNYPFMLAPGKNVTGVRWLTGDILKKIESIWVMPAAMQFPNHFMTCWFQWQAWALMHSSPSLFAWEEVYPIKLPLRQFLWLDVSSCFWASPDCEPLWFGSSLRVWRRASCFRNEYWWNMMNLYDDNIAMD